MKFWWQRILTIAAIIFPLNASAIDIKEIYTEGGLKVLHVEDHSLPIITLSFSFRGGATQDLAGKEGALSLLGALLDEGAGPYEAAAYQNRLEDLAARISFRASRDFFNGSMSTLTANQDGAFEMLKLALYQPRLDEQPLNRIRDQIISSIKAANNNPNSQAARAMRAMIYPDGHTYRRPVRGTEETLAALTSDDLFEIKKRVLGQDNLIISIVGDITESEVKSRIDALFGDLPERAELTPVEKVEPRLGGTKFIKADRPQTRFSFVGRGIDRHDPDYIAAYLVNQILGGSGLTSRLSYEVREKRGLAYGISTGLTNHVFANLFSGSVATRSAFADETLEVLNSELKRMADEGPTAEELELAKSYTIGVYALNFDGSRDIAGTLTSLQAQNLPTDYIKTRPDIINSVTLEQTKAVAKRLLGEGNYTLVRMGSAPKQSQ